MIGKTISHYKILEKLGSGGMGVVYKARDLHLNRFVSLKFLPQHFGADENEKERFVHEAKAASSLQHNNICTVHEIAETEDGQLFICMDFYEGETLKKKIEGDPLKLEEVLNIAIQISQGLHKTHQQGIIHRDIKPANIIITEDGVVKIVDFGLAKLAGQTKLTKTGTTIGTVAYMSPEQVRGEAIDNRTDIWALGVILYEMLTGQSPFNGEYEQAVMYSIVNEEPEALENLRKDIPTELQQIIANALAKRPEERYEKIEDMISDLKSLSEGSKPEKIKLKRFRRRRVPFPMILTALILLISVAVVIILLYPSKSIAFAERDWILITDFENLTGEDVLDRSLNTALTVSIEQSSYINVFQRNRMVETLRRMTREEMEHIDEKVGREMAIREGINILIVPSISSIGNTYALIGRIQDANSGTTLTSEIYYAQTKDDILSALDKMSKKIRRDLGESLGTISKQGKPLSKVTTSSLEALKQYSLGIENHWNANLEEARFSYESALEIDSTFTAAKASLGMLLLERFGGDREMGEQLLKAAVKHIENLTDREKYGILAFYANGVENDIEKAVNYMKMLLNIYPDDYTARNNLGWYYRQMGRYEDAVTEYKKALRINPYLMFTYNGLNWIYLNLLGELDSALVWSKRQISYNDQNPWGYDFLGWAYIGKDSLEKAQWAFQKALELNPQFILDLYRLSHVYRLQSRYQDAIQPLKKILEIDQTETSANYNLGINYQFMGDAESARRQFEKFKQEAERSVNEDSENGYGLINLALALTRLGQKRQGWSMGQKAMKRDSSQHFGYAQLLSIQGKIPEAIDQLELAVQKGDRNYIWMKIHPDFHPLYGDPRFKELINRGLTK